MKKIFTFISLFVFGSIYLQAEVLWEGSQTYSDYKTFPEPGKHVKLDKSLFVLANVGDKLTIDFLENSMDPQTWHQVQLFDQNINNELTTGYHISNGDTKCSFILDNTLLTKLKTDGCALAGTGYTVTKVSIEANNGMLWEGHFFAGDWKSITINKEVFANIQETDDFLIFHFNDVPNGAGLVLRQNLTQGWANMPSGIDWIPIEAKQLSYKMTPEDCATMKDNGLVITGMNYTLIGISATTSVGINNIKIKHINNSHVYNINDIKVAENLNNLKSLPKGFYISGNRKIIVK